MWTSLLNKWKSSYPAVSILLTRLVGSLGGLLTIAYVNLTGAIPDELLSEFRVIASWSVLAAVVSTTWLSLSITRKLRSVVCDLFQGRTPTREDGDEAVLEAIRFNLVHHRRAAWVVPLVTTIPVASVMRFAYQLDWYSTFHVVVATLLGIALSLLMMYFLTEPAFAPLIRMLTAKGFAVPKDHPIERLQYRVMMCFSVILLCAITMIGAVAVRRMHEFRDVSPVVEKAVGSLEAQLTVISLISLVIGLVYSRLLAHSVTSRVGEIVRAMNSVQQGNLSERVEPRGNDEVELLGHRFNDMIAELDRRTSEVRDLNANLEHQVETRTEELSDSLKKLQVLDQMKTEFFSNVSHELRTPLMLILSPIRQLKTELDDFLDPRSSSLLDVAEVNGQRLLKQINQLLEFSKVQAGRTKIVESAVDLNEIARRLAYAASPFAEQRGLTLQVDLDPELPATTSDEDKLDIVLTNLVSNAIKFTPSGGTVRIVSKLVFDEQANRRLRLAVEDTGHGIAEEDFPRLFQRFVQLDGSLSREHAGTGLGLALVRELIELLGGQVGVESQIDQGSVFFFELPWKQLQPETVTLESPSGVIRQESFSELRTCHIEASTEPRPAPPAFAPRVLIVEDNTEIRELLVDLLSREYNVTVAEHGLHALTLLERSTPDLILSDVMMPYIDGQELCRRVKQRKETANVPFILLTARSKTTMKIEGLDCGAEDYVCKPFEEAELLARVRALLRVRRANVQLDQRNVELERINKELKQTQQQLVQAEKLSSLGQLVAGLAHEINNSINAVYNGVPALKLRLQKLRKMLSTQTGSEPARIAPDVAAHFEKMDTLYEVILDGAERTARIVSDMKTFAHPGRERNEDFDLHRALDLCLNLSVKQSAGKVEIIRKYGDVPVIHGPFGQLHQVFLNLLSNAAQAMPDGGQVYVQTVRDDDWFTVHIRDTGTGIPERIRNKIFEPFFTTKAPGVGTGLGLSISYSIVTKLGGKIECHSEMGVGTEFVVSIPMVVGASSGELSVQRLEAGRV
jgi:signal transduction histidine kinase